MTTKQGPAKTLNRRGPGDEACLVHVTNERDNAKGEYIVTEEWWLDVTVAPLRRGPFPTEAKARAYFKKYQKGQL
jgi:hypothetical protein